MRDSDVLLLPSRAEGMSMALIEAMSWALAVVTTNAGGAQAFLEDGCNSVLVAPGDVSGIRQAIAICFTILRGESTSGLRHAGQSANSASTSYMTKLTSLYEELGGLGIDDHANAKPATTADYSRTFVSQPADQAARGKP